MATRSTGRNKDTYGVEDKKQEVYREFDQCSLYRNQMFEELCDPELFLNEYAATQQNGSEYTGDVLCDGCLTMDEFMEQWLEDVETFHSLVHGSLTWAGNRE